MSEAPSILAATDFSPHARHAAERAALIAHESAAKLDLLHVIPGHALAQVRAWLGAGAALDALLRDEAHERLNELAQRLRSGRHVQVDPVVMEGAVLDVTLQEAQRVDARLIVLGARGAGFMRRMLLGTTAERLMRRTTRPALVVRQSPRERYRRVLVAVDFSPWSMGALEAARWVAPHAHLVLTTVFQVPYEEKLRLAGVDASTVARYRDHARAEATQRLHELALRAGLHAGHWEACVAEGDPAFRLVEMEPELDCDLVAVGKHGTSMVSDMLLGSVTHHLLAEAQGDVLISAVRES